MKGQASLCLASIAVFFTWSCGLVSTRAEDSLAKEIVRDTGIKKGVCTILGDKDGALAMALAQQGDFLIHVLEPDSKNVQKARDNIVGKGVYSGRLFAEQCPASRLPYPDNFVNLLIVCDTTLKVATENSRFQAGFYPFGFKAKGTYLWYFGATNWIERKRGPNDNTKDTMAFHCPFGVVSSHSLEAIREGADDVRYGATYVQLAQQKGIDPEKLLGPIRKQSRDAMRRGKQLFYDAEVDWRVTINKPGKLHAWRTKIIQAILGLKATEKSRFRR